MPNRVPFALVVLVTPLLIPPLARAQSTNAINPAAKAIAMAAKLPAYDVVSIHQNKTGGNWSFQTTDDGLIAKNCPLLILVQYAYNLGSLDLISGLSGPLESAGFDINAKLSTRDGTMPGKLTDDQLQAMMIPLLADRFHLKVHLETQIKPVYDLVVAKGGPKIKLSQDEIHDASWNTSFEGTNKVITAKGLRMIDLADALSNLAGRKVIDKTGLTGHADITLKWSDDVAAQQGSADTISIFTAVEDQLGLKLQPSKGPVDTLVIDHAEMPTEN
ncbi:MAG TPA: TIGR03435 family protein [Acidobacteriaceae bacterium]|nr:TIGR03435 family protein [Acidobacteriaceae bacterium]